MTIDCATDTDFIDGKITGFLAGGRVLLRYNGLDGLELAENGVFMFPCKMAVLSLSQWSNSHPPISNLAVTVWTLLVRCRVAMWALLLCCVQGCL